MGECFWGDESVFDIVFSLQKWSLLLRIMRALQKGMFEEIYRLLMVIAIKKTVR
ncbi:hypothetical protein [Bartonella doshiae]|uniref:hypothetical protein n=1 Tax=Bartonella doshiae TaxID=33044 RepID=UPI001ABB2AB6|nr:hypothetical protein [Bartonella doshiae]